jgi:ankyrin repeat protein
VPEAAEGKDDTPAAAGSSRSAKTLPRPAYEGDPQALINVCAAGGSGDVEEARDLLIARGINVDEQDEDQNTALYCATGHGDIDFVRELIRAGAALDVKNHIGKTALQKTVYGHVDIVRELIRAGDALDVKDQDGETVLQLAHRVALLEEAEAAAAGATVDEGGGGSGVPEAAEGKDDAPAAAAGSSRPVKTLPRPAYDGDLQALIKLCDCDGSGDVEEARDLITRGINVDEQDEYQQTALHYAISSYNTDIVQELIRAGAVLDVKDCDGDTALHSAAEEGFVAIVRELISAGAALDVKNHIGKTALQKAREGHREWSRADVVALLEEAEAEAAAKAAVNEGGECSVPESAEGKDDGK